MARDVVSVLEGECRAISDLVFEINESQFTRPTRCEPWTVKDLLAHMWRNLFRIPTALKESVPDEVQTDRISYWRSYDPAADAQAIADHAQETSATYASGHDLAVAFDQLWRDCVAQVQREEPRRVIKLWWGAVMHLDEFLKTRVLENVVHGLDLTDALDAPPIATKPGVDLVVEVIEGLLEAPVPEGAGWEPLGLIRKATGRASISADELRALGSLGDRLPVLR